jgi:hypothetical protein
MSKALIAKPVVKNQFWIVTDGKEKVGNVIADGSGYEVKINGSKSHYKNTKAIEKEAKIQFQPTFKSISSNKGIPLQEYPTPSKVYNSVIDVKRKLHLFTKNTKSKCYYAAGWFVIEQGEEKEVLFCPKYIFIQRYKYKGPYKTKDEANFEINN